MEREVSFYLQAEDEAGGLARRHGRLICHEIGQVRGKWQLPANRQGSTIKANSSLYVFQTKTSALTFYGVDRC